MVMHVILIFIATLFYNVINGLSSIFIAKGIIKAGAFFNALQNVVYILILSFVILEVKDNYWLFIPLFLGYGAGMLISGEIINRMKIGTVTIIAFINGEQDLAENFAKNLSAHGIMNTNFIGTGSRSKTIAIVVITKRKEQESTIKQIQALAEISKLPVKITVSETAEWQ